MSGWNGRMRIINRKTSYLPFQMSKIFQIYFNLFSIFIFSREFTSCYPLHIEMSGWSGKRLIINRKKIKKLKKTRSVTCYSYVLMPPKSLLYLFARPSFKILRSILTDNRFYFQYRTLRPFTLES